MLEAFLLRVSATTLALPGDTRWSNHSPLGAQYTSLVQIQVFLNKNVLLAAMLGEDIIMNNASISSTQI